MAIICTDQDFLTSARIYEKEILTMPVKRLQDLLDYFSIRLGVRYTDTQYDMDADMEYGPYDPKRKKNLDTKIGARIYRNYFGSDRVEFDPNDFYKTFLGSDITQGEGLKGVEIARRLLNICSAKLGDKLYRHVLDAKRDDAGTTTKTLFNGLDTITFNEITSNNISAEKGNLFSFTEAITSNNAVEAIKAFCAKADDFLMDKEVNLLVSKDIYRYYLEDYKATTGAVPYNLQYKQTTVEGYENVTFKPMGQKRNSQFLTLSPKSNLLLLFNLMGGGPEKEKITVEKHDVVLLTFFATIFFGVDFKSIFKEDLLIGKLYGGPAAPTITASTNTITITGESGSTLSYRVGDGKVQTSSTNTATVTATAETNGQVIVAQALKGGMASDSASHTIVYTA